MSPSEARFILIHILTYVEERVLLQNTSPSSNTDLLEDTIRCRPTSAR